MEVLPPATNASRLLKRFLAKQMGESPVGQDTHLHWWIHSSKQMTVSPQAVRRLAGVDLALYLKFETNICNITIMCGRFWERGACARVEAR